MNTANNQRIAAPSRRGLRYSRGYLEVEMIIVLVLVTIMAGAVGLMLSRAQKAQRHVQRQSTIAVTGQDIIEKMRKEVSSSVLLFKKDLLGQAYFAGLDTATVVPLASSRLPVLSSKGTFRKDEIGSEKTGNVLIYAFHDRTDSFNVGTEEMPKLVRSNIYRIVAWYLVEIPGKDSASEVAAFDLVHWVSEALVDRDQVDKIVDPLEKDRLLIHLFAGSNPEEPQLPYAPTRHLWKLAANFDAAFAEFDENAVIQPVPEDFKIPMSPTRSRSQHLGFKRLALSSNVAGSRRGLARFGIQDNTGDGFPHGLEIQLIGPVSARQVLIHMTLCSDSPPSEQAWLNLQAISATRDL